MQIFLQFFITFFIPLIYSILLTPSHQSRRKKIVNPHSKAQRSKSFERSEIRRSARVITLNIDVDTNNMTIAFLYIYDKSEMENVSDKLLRQIIKNLGLN